MYARPLTTLDIDASKNTGFVKRNASIADISTVFLPQESENTTIDRLGRWIMVAGPISIIYSGSTFGDILRQVFVGSGRKIGLWLRYDLAPVADKLLTYLKLKDGWAGDDTRAPSAQAYTTLAFVLNAMPANIIAPSAFVDEEGELGLQWRNNDTIATVSTSGDGLVYYSIHNESGEPSLFGEFESPACDLRMEGKLPVEFFEAVAGIFPNHAR